MLLTPATPGSIFDIPEDLFYDVLDIYSLDGTAIPLLWCPAMDLSYGIKLWCPAMIPYYGALLWSPAMVHSYGGQL